MTKLTTKQVQSKYRDKYVEVYSTYDYSSRQELHEVRNVFDEIHENTTLGQDVGTDRAYTR